MTAQTELEKQVNQACREALLKLKFAEEKEALLLKQVEELKALNSTQAEQVRALFEANAKHEAAIIARTAAEGWVAELRANHAAQMAQAEKALAVANLKTRLWQILAGVAAVLAIIASAGK